MLNRRGLLILGSAAASLTLIGNREVMALVPETDRFHRAAAGAQQVIVSLPVEYHVYRVVSTTADRGGTAPYPYDERRPYFRTPEFLAIRQAWWDRIRDRESLRGWMGQTDAFLGRLLEDFRDAGHPDPRVARDLFDGKLRIEVLSDADLRQQVPAIVPVAVLRSLVADRKAPFHMKEMPNYLEVAQHYRDAIMI
jgi:hypothetical protein